MFAVVTRLDRVALVEVFHTEIKLEAVAEAPSVVTTVALVEALVVASVIPLVVEPTEADTVVARAKTSRFPLTLSIFHKSVPEAKSVVDSPCLSSA